MRSEYGVILQQNKLPKDKVKHLEKRVKETQSGASVCAGEKTAKFQYWIPTWFALPDPGQRCLVSTACEEVTIGECKVIGGKHVWIVDPPFQLPLEVIAWMLLPDPYSRKQAICGE